MSALFLDYKIALLDSSFFSSEFTNEIKSSLSAIRVYVANSFNAEIEQYKFVLSDERREAYEKNVAFLQQNMKLNTLNLDSVGDKKQEINNDTWGMISLLIGLEAKFVVVTANRILIQRIILNSLDADIFDLNENRFILARDFDKLHSQYEISKSVSSSFSSFSFKANENTVLFCKNGSRIVLGDEFNSGMEANLYHVHGQKNIIAKVFKKGKLSREKFANITDLVGMNEKMGIEWAIFPCDIIYYDEACTIPAGFIEKYVKTNENLDQNPLYLGNIDLTDDSFRSKQSTAIELAIKIVRQVCYLNSYGYFISDFNTGNFAMPANNQKTVQMWDTDSFGFNNYFSGYCAGYQTSREYDTSTKIGAIEYCIDALYVFVFSLLSLGDSPISENTGKFKYDNPNCRTLYRKKLFPENLWALFTEVFRGEKVPSAETLLDYLSVAYNELIDNPQKNPTYCELLAPQLSTHKKIDGSSEGSLSRLGGNGASSKDDSKSEDKKPPENEKRKVRPWIKVIIAIAVAMFAITVNWNKISSCVGLSASGKPYSIGSNTTIPQLSTEAPTHASVVTPNSTVTPTPKPSATPTPKPSVTSTPKPSATPTPKPTATPTQTIDAMNHFAYGMDLGHMFAIALKSNGTVVTVGRNDNGQRNVSSWRGIVQVAAGWNFSLGLTSDGHVLIAGTDSKDSPRISSSAIASWNNIIFIAANANAAAAIDKNGSIFITGGPDESNSVYTIPSDIYSAGKPVAVSVGVNHILVLYDSGKVRAIFNENINGCCNVNGWENIVQVAAGDNISVALTDNGNVLYIGGSDYGKPNDNISNAVSISSKGAHLVYLKKDGTIGATGWNKFGQCDVDTFNNISGKHVTAVATSGWNTLILFSDGSVESIGSSNNIPASEVREWRNIVRIG